MKNESEFQLINKETLADLMRRAYRANYMVIMLTYICQRENVKLYLSLTEVCKLFNIRPAVLKQHTKKKWIKSNIVEGVHFYSAYDICLYAEKVKRRFRVNQLKKVPVMPQFQSQQTNG